jgi:hypothetical protein
MVKGELEADLIGKVGGNEDHFGGIDDAIHSGDMAVALNVDLDGLFGGTKVVEHSEFCGALED